MESTEFRSWISEQLPEQNPSDVRSESSEIRCQLNLVQNATRFSPLRIDAL
jgi:hypothetical protein